MKGIEVMEMIEDVFDFVGGRFERVIMFRLKDGVKVDFEMKKVVWKEVCG